MFNEYINDNIKLFIKDIEGYVYNTTWNSLRQNKYPSKFHKSNPYTIQNINHFIELNAEGYELLSTEYKNSNKDKLLFKCFKGHEFEMSWSHFYQGQRCTYCSNQKVLKGYNDIATTDPWMVKYFKDKEDGYIYTRNSNKKIKVICPDCKKEKEIKIYNFYKSKSISCSCGDGTSYPEKFIISLLDQLEVKYTKEYKPEWGNGKRYDFYFECGYKKRYIIECHGKQHYEEQKRGRTLQEEQQNDLYKKQLALNNGINEYIVLDCRESNLELIKNSVLQSKLNNIFNLNDIDWLQCEEFALSNRVKEICDYWHLHNEINQEGLTAEYVSKIFKLSKTVIIYYLNKGVKLGWCNYNPKKEQSKGAIKSGKCKSKTVEIFKDGKSLGIFPSCAELERQSEELFGVKLLNSNISAVCCGERKHHKGFTFKYVDKQN